MNAGTRSMSLPRIPCLHCCEPEHGCRILSAHPTISVNTKQHACAPADVLKAVHSVDPCVLGRSIATFEEDWSIPSNNYKTAETSSPNKNGHECHAQESEWLEGHTSCSRPRRRRTRPWPRLRRRWEDDLRARFRRRSRATLAVTQRRN